MILKTAKILATVAAVTATAVGSHKLGYKLGELIVNRYYKPRITEINVWHGPVPTHPSQQ